MVAFMSLPYTILLMRSHPHLFPSRALIILSVFGPFLSLRWAVLYDREKSRADPTSWRGSLSDAVSSTGCFSYPKGPFHYS